ncbi:MAG: hypothetical protein ACXWIG_18775, partial [Caldimonas sp.]
MTIPIGDAETAAAPYCATVPAPLLASRAGAAARLDTLSDRRLPPPDPMTDDLVFRAEALAAAVAAVVRAAGSS